REGPHSHDGTHFFMHACHRCVSTLQIRRESSLTKINHASECFLSGTYRSRNSTTRRTLAAHADYISQRDSIKELCGVGLSLHRITQVDADTTVLLEVKDQCAILYPADFC
ncbi:unnamed protein product, partial [Amoebophrya sp. A120]